MYKIITPELNYRCKNNETLGKLVNLLSSTDDLSKKRLCDVVLSEDFIGNFFAPEDYSDLGGYIKYKFKEKERYNYRNEPIRLGFKSFTIPTASYGTF